MQAQALALKGYKVVVPDLYRGKLTVEAEEAHHLMTDLDWEGAIKDIRAAAEFLQEDGTGKVRRARAAPAALCSHQN